MVPTTAVLAREDAQWAVLLASCTARWALAAPPHSVPRAQLVSAPPLLQAASAPRLSFETTAHAVVQVPRAGAAQGSCPLSAEA
jgi:hypothetical protein